MTSEKICKNAGQALFATLSAKGNIRDEKSRDVIQFFSDEGCADYIDKIRGLTT
jgi:hypothetical protein